MAEAPSLETLKAKLDGALSNLVWLQMSLLTAGVLGQMASKGPFQPKAFYDSVIKPTASRIGCLRFSAAQSSVKEQL